VATAGDIPLDPMIKEDFSSLDPVSSLNFDSDATSPSPLDDNLDSSPLLFLSGDGTGAISNNQVSSCLSPAVRKRKLTNEKREDLLLG
jgi:hypothetical protein